MKALNPDDYVGKTYNRLMIIECFDCENGRRFVLAKCECGTIKKYNIYSVVNGHTSSCGCLRKETTIKRSTIHGLTEHPLYTVWQNMKIRCYNQSDKSFKNYGGRGVTVCDEWKYNFHSFYDWAIANGWKEGLEIDKDIFGNGLLYSSDTCCFVTKKVNSRNKRSNILIEYNGVVKTIGQWSEDLEIRYETLWYRLIKLKWHSEKAFTTPVKIGNNQWM